MTLTRPEQAIQEQQYAIPYHYIPRVDGSGFTQSFHWRWGIRYLGGIQVVKDRLAKVKFTSLADVGCGDGRLLFELGNEFPQKELVGIDYSERAVTLANAMNPAAKYLTRNILVDKFETTFDVVTCIEVLEHIPIADVPKFVECLAALVAPGGELVVTVPHKNKPLTDKHFQHFDSKSLRAALEGHFSSIEIMPFDGSSLPFRLLETFMTRLESLFVITHKGLMGFFFRHYKEKVLYPESESSSKRIAAFAQKAK